MMAKNKEMSKSDVKFTKILFLIISILLVLFFGSGIYFMRSSAMGAGFLGIGVALLGLGIMGLFADGVLYQSVSGPAAEPSKRVKKRSNVSDVTDPEFQMDATVGYCDRDGSSKNGVVYLCTDRIYIKHLEEFNVMILYSDLKNIMQEKNRVVLVGMFNLDSHLKNESVYISCESLIKLKAFMQVLDDKIRRYNAAIVHNTRKAGDPS